MPGYVRLVEVRTGKFWLSDYGRLGKDISCYFRLVQVRSGLFCLCQSRSDSFWSYHFMLG
jgi:hypothetical protein